MGEIGAAVGSVRQRIAAACDRVGREPAEVRLLPVSKTVGPDRVREAVAAGCLRFGENRVQELVAKSDALEDVVGLSFAVLGHLQTNKVRDVARLAAEFQALDSLRLAAELDRRLQREGRQLDVLVEVNSSGEDSKFGLPPADVPDFVRALAPFDALRVRGLMTLALPSPDRRLVAECFDRMRQARDAVRQTGVPDFDELSMGMSGDFELAIEHGSTVVRIGRAIFGERR